MTESASQFLDNVVGLNSMTQQFIFILKVITMAKPGGEVLLVDLKIQMFQSIHLI